mgnify:CR=1 FL=1
MLGVHLENTLRYVYCIIIIIFPATATITTISHLSHLVRRGPEWVAVLQGTKFHQRIPSDSIVNITSHYHNHQKSNINDLHKQISSKW